MSLILLPGETPDDDQEGWELVAVQTKHGFENTNVRPIVVVARRATGERDFWVLKPLAQLGPGESIKELVAYRLASLCGIPVPEFGTVRVTEEAIRDLPAPLRSRLAASLGPNFATRFVRGVMDLANPLEVAPEHRQVACDVFAFDIAIDNVDRRKENSNLLIGDRGIMAIDHQHTFSWCSPTSTGPDRWQAGALHRLLPGHFFGPVLADWLESYARLRKALPSHSHVASELTAEVPELWLARGGEIYRDRIREYLESVFGHWEELLAQIEGAEAA